MPYIKTSAPPFFIKQSYHVSLGPPAEAVPIGPVHHTVFCCSAAPQLQPRVTCAMSNLLAAIGQFPRSHSNTNLPIPKLHPFPSIMFRATARTAKSGFRRFYSADHHHEAPAAAQGEIDLSKVFGVAFLAGLSLYFYRSSKEPVLKTALYEFQDERENLRNEAYLKRYKTSFIKTFMRDKGGVGQRQFRREALGPIPQTLIHAHSPYGDQFGAGIKTDKLGPRRERTKYFAPIEN